MALAHAPQTLLNFLLREERPALGDDDMGFQPLVPVLTVATTPASSAAASLPPSTPPPRQRKVFQGLQSVARGAKQLSPAATQGQLPQGDTHLPRGSVPNGARPPSDTAQLQLGSHMPRLSMSGTRPPEQTTPAKRRKTAIPSFSLDDSPPSSPEAGHSAPAPQQKLGDLRLEVAGVKFYKDSARAAAYEGATVLFEREPANPYDPNAMRICVKGAKQSQLGHVPRNVAAFLAPLIDGAQICLEAGKILKVQRAPNSDVNSIEVSLAVLDLPNAPQPGAQLKKALDDKRAELLKGIQRLAASSGQLSQKDLVAAASRAPTPQQQKHQQAQERPSMQAQQRQPQHAHTPQALQSRQRLPEPEKTNKVSAEQQQASKQQAILLARQQAQEEQVKRHKQQKALEALDTSPLIPSISAAHLLSQDGVCPAPIRWELVLQRGGRFAGSCLQMLPAAMFTFFRHIFFGHGHLMRERLACSPCSTQR